MTSVLVFLALKLQNVKFDEVITEETLRLTHPCAYYFQLIFENIFKVSRLNAGFLSPYTSHDSLTISYYRIW